MEIYYNTYSQTCGLLGSICIFILTSIQLEQPLKEAKQKGLLKVIINHYFLFVCGSALLIVSYIVQLYIGYNSLFFGDLLFKVVGSYIVIGIFITIYIFTRYRSKKSSAHNKIDLPFDERTYTVMNNKDLLLAIKEIIQEEINPLKIEISAINSKIAAIEHTMATKNQQDKTGEFIQSLLLKTVDLNAKFDTTANNDDIARLNAKLDNINTKLFNIEADLQLLKLNKN